MNPESFRCAVSAQDYQLKSALVLGKKLSIRLGLSMVRRITVESIESFRGQNIEELSYFSRDKLKSGFRRHLIIHTIHYSMFLSFFRTQDIRLFPLCHLPILSILCLSSNTQGK